MRTRSMLLFSVALLSATACHYRHDHCGRGDDWDEDCDEGWCAPRADGGPRRDSGPAPSPADAGPPAPEPECVSEIDCDASELCIEGSCVPEAEACHSDSHCGAGRSCVDGACRPFCDTDASCPSGTRCDGGRCLPAAECDSDASCAAGERCVEQRCLPECGESAPCAHPEDVCTTEGLCRPDTARRPFCESDAECAEGRLCLSGVCRTPCPTGTQAECLAWDSQFVRCGLSESGLLLCFTRQETDPECVSASECESGERCIDAFCH